MNSSAVVEHFWKVLKTYSSGSRSSGICTKWGLGVVRVMIQMILKNDD